MERFAFKIDAALRANLYKICRLCGIDNPSKVPILPKGSEIIDLDEPSLSQKVQELIGFTVKKDDKMPQTMCSLCVDKINDFYEFREMCYATNKQTRNLLGLKHAEPQKLMDIKPIFKSEPLAVTAASKTRARKRKTDDVAAETASGSGGKSNTSGLALDTVKSEPLTWRKKQRLQQQQQQQQLQVPDIKEEPIDSDANNKLGLAGKKRRKASCSVCGERFLSKELAEKHKAVVHVPTILRYACHACNQTHNSPSDIKAHQLWHKLSKTPYQCPLCHVNVANNYAFTRHLREHTVPTPIELLVLDRECPLCKKTFLTNFFYNTHPCARRTRKCGGCSRALNSDVAYMKHAPHCPKIYLNHSKHIMPEVADNEAQMRIKNEFGVDNEEIAMSSGTYPQDNMQPVVVLERLSSPLLRASVGPNSLGKASDRVSTKSYLKRVDQLLKNTMSTLVSIKHEPEVHIDDAGPLPGAEQAESEPDEEPAGNDDFHFNADNDDSDEDAPATDANAATVTVKQEVVDESYQEQQEQGPSGDGVQIKQEPLKLKLKITNNHGQLNSSLVDDDLDPQSQSKSAKKKKKRKHKERNRESETSDKTPPAEANPDETLTPAQATVEDSSNAIVTIKQERLDDNYGDVGTAQAEPQFEPQATVMTSIPMLQLDSSYSEENQATNIRSSQESEDVKPNRLELDRLIQITHIASGVAMAEEALPPENAVEALPNETQTENPVKPVNKTARKSTARKSTAGIPREAAKSSLSDSTVDSVPQDAASLSASSSGSIPREASTSSASSLNEMQLPQIVSVESGASVPFNMIAIKPEPRNRGYADESEQEEVAEANAPGVNEINHNKKMDEEAAYINSLDLSNVTIKQEKDLHISDVSVNGSETDNLHFNGLHQSECSEGDDDEDENDSASSADEAEEHMDTYEEEEERIYREIELPPLEEQTPVDNTTLEAESKEKNMQRDEENMQVEPENMSVESENMQVESSNTAVEAESLPMESETMQVEKENIPVEPETIQESENVVQETPAIVEELHSAPAQNETEMMQIESEDHLILADAPKESQLEEELASTEPQLATTSASAFNFIITSVCTQAVEALPSNDEVANADNNLAVLDEPQKSEDNEENITCPEVTLSVPKDNETLAQPFYTTSNSSASYNCDEEQQNVLNHELAVTDPQELQQLALPAVEVQEEQEESEAGPSVTACNELTGNEESSAHEETENRINEQQQQQQQQQQQPQQRCEINDDYNINEIAENNNNANIERELNDDANVAQENPNI